MSLLVTVKEKIAQSFTPTYVDVVDESDGCGAKLKLTIVSEKFADKTLLESHRLVYDALKEEMPSIHALSIITKSPSQWKGP